MDTFSALWNSLFNWFDSCIIFFSDVVEWVTTPISNILVPSDQLPNVINKVIEFLNSRLPNTPLVSVLLGSGIIFFLTFTILKYFVDIVT